MQQGKTDDPVGQEHALGDARIGFGGTLEAEHAHIEIHVFRVRVMRWEAKVSDALRILELAEDRFWKGMSDQAKNLRKSLLAVLEKKTRDGTAAG